MPTKEEVDKAVGRLSLCGCAGVALILAVASAISLTVGCGNTAVGSVSAGQVKKVSHITPLFCPERDNFSMSLGILREGEGSISTEDLIVQIGNPADIPVLQEAVRTGAIVEIRYDTRRFLLCGDDRLARMVTLAP